MALSNQGRLPRGGGAGMDPGAVWVVVFDQRSGLCSLSEHNPSVSFTWVSFSLQCFSSSLPRVVHPGFPECRLPWW